MSGTEQEGILTVVARTAGIKLKIDGVESNWINPEKDAKESMLKDLSNLKAMTGKEVRIYLNAENDYSMIELVKEPVPEKVKEERIDEAVNEPTTVKTVKEKNYFTNLEKIKCETKTIGSMKLTYISWAEAWRKLKQVHEDANYLVHENSGGMPYFVDATGGFVKVSVTVKHVTHTVHLPIMDNRNKSIKLGELDTFAINKNIQRAFAKAIAMHGLGIGVYNGEEF